MPDLSCLVVEDEALAAGLLADYIGQIPGLRLAGICTNAMQATEFLANHKTDLIFLDIHLPRISGMDFARSLSNKYPVVFTTAHHEYASESYELNAVDYLLKPISFPRFLQAVAKVFQLKGKPTETHSIQQGAERVSFFFNTDKKQVRIFVDEIMFVESLKDYVKIVTASQTVVTRFQIGELMVLLQNHGFIRTHKSFIVNSKAVTAFNAQEVEIGKRVLPIGRTYKELVESQLRQLPG